MINKEPKFVDFLLTSFSLLAFWYAYYCIDKQVVNLRGSKVELHQSPFMYWFFLSVIVCAGIYCIYLAWFKKQEM